MAQWHHIFCRADATLPRAELAEHITDAWYGDGSPNITSASTGGTAWQLSVELPGAPPRRIDLLLDSAQEVVAELVGEFLDEHRAQLPREVTDVLRDSRQVVSIGLKPDLLDDDAWELLDVTEAFIARRLDGVVAIADDGVYDRDLQRLVRLGSPPT